MWELRRWLAEREEIFIITFSFSELDWVEMRRTGGQGTGRGRAGVTASYKLDIRKLIADSFTDWLYKSDAPVSRQSVGPGARYSALIFWYSHGKGWSHLATHSVISNIYSARASFDNHFIDPLGSAQLSSPPLKVKHNQLSWPADVDYVHYYLLLHYRHCVPSIKLCPISQPQNTNRKTHFLSLTISTQCRWTRVASLGSIQTQLFIVQREKK